MKRFNVVVVRPDGGVEVYPMKEWLRRNPDHVPEGLDPTNSTSHQLRGGLKRVGWTVEELATEVRLIMPGARDVDEVEAVLGGPDEEIEDEEGVSFALEAQLRDFIAKNIAAIPVGDSRLRLFADDSGRSGVEYPTGVGFIDILAVSDADELVIFELKLDRGPDRAIGQLLRYLGWVKRHLAGHRTVKGVIVAKAINEKLRYAAAATANITLLEYEITFSVSPVGLDGEGDV